LKRSGLAAGGPRPLSAVRTPNDPRPLPTPVSMPPPSPPPP